MATAARVRIVFSHIFVGQTVVHGWAQCKGYSPFWLVLDREFTHGHPMKKFAILLVLLGVTACGGPARETPPDITVPAQPTLPTGIDDGCKANKNANLIGMSSDQLESTLLLLPIRVIRPNAIVTQDYRPNRLNVHVDDAGTVTRLSCG
jgi:hypothetical protein